MANTVYAKAKEGLLTGAVNWLTDDIRAILIDLGAYTPNFTTDDFLDDIPSGARVAVSASLTGKTATGGVADADDPTFTAVSGPTVEAVLVYKHTGTDSTARLICLDDTGTGLPVTPNGGDIVVQWSNGASKIFAL